jgi:hypothetical protein
MNGKRLSCQSSVEHVDHVQGHGFHPQHQEKEKILLKEQNGSKLLNDEGMYNKIDSIYNMWRENDNLGMPTKLPFKNKSEAGAVAQAYNSSSRWRLGAS